NSPSPVRSRLVEQIDQSGSEIHPEFRFLRELFLRQQHLGLRRAERPLDYCLPLDLRQHETISAITWRLNNNQWIFWIEQAGTLEMGIFIEQRVGEKNFIGTSREDCIPFTKRAGGRYGIDQQGGTEHDGDNQTNRPQRRSRFRTVAVRHE